MKVSSKFRSTIRTGRKSMQDSISSSKVSPLAGVITVVSWICVGGPAWAGGGGADLASLNSFVSEMCARVGLTPCPQLPTISQAALEFAGLQNSTVEQVRAFDNDAPAANAGNAATDTPA